MFITIFIGFFIILALSIFTIVYIGNHRERYKTTLYAFLLILSIFNAGIIYSSLYVFSNLFYFSDSINIALWKFSLISGMISLGVTSVIYSFLKEYKKIHILPALIYITLFGFLLGSLLSLESITIQYDGFDTTPHFIMDISTINFSFQRLLGVIVSVLQIGVVIYYITISLLIYRGARYKKKIILVLFLNTIIFCFPILFYILYVFIPLSLFRDLHIITLWIDIGGVCLMILRGSDLFLDLTNKVYSINIYHKSGILLYSYKFKNIKENQDQNDSAIWGNILIGINHILSEFIDKNDQIDVMQTEVADIVVNYNNEYGFAVLIIAKKKNVLLEHLVKDFIDEFKIQYNEELNYIQDLNRIISVSDFNDVNKLIEKNFFMYL